MHARSTVTALASLTLALGGAVVLASPAVAADHVGEIDGVRYLVDDTDVAAGALVLGPGSADLPAELVIPATVDVAGRTYDVTEINTFAFRDAPITSVAVPHTVRQIGAGAFMDAPVATLDLADGVMSIGQVAFYGGELTTLTLPDSVTTLGTGSFIRNRLESVVIGAGVTDLPPAVFADNLLTDLTLPDTVTSIDVEAFAGNPTLRSLDVGDGVVTVGQAAFAEAEALEELRLGASVRTIGPAAFWGTAALTEVTIPAGVTAIDDAAFLYNDALARVRFDGPAPTTGVETFPPTATLEYRWRHDVSQVADGFTTPTWRDWTTEAIASLRWFAAPDGLLRAEDAVVGTPLAVPAPPSVHDPDRPFVGWFTDAEGTSPLDVDAPVPGDLDVYAGFRQDMAPPVEPPAAPTGPDGPAVAPTSPPGSPSADGDVGSDGDLGAGGDTAPVSDRAPGGGSGPLATGPTGAPLAVTGVDAAPLAGAALAMVVLGGLLLRIARRRAAA